MKLTRRDFLKLAGLSTVGAVACDFFREGEMEIQSAVELPEDLVTGQDNWYATICGHCPEKEGIVVRVVEGRAKKVRGNPLYPTNWGKQSTRCDGSLQAIYHPDRLTSPLLRKKDTPRGAGEWWNISWGEVRDRIFPDVLGTRLRNAGLADSVLVITEPLRGHLGQLVSQFREAYGARHLALEPLEETSYRAAIKGVFGQDRLPDLDIENSDYILSFGADWLSTWLSPVRNARAYGRFRSLQGKKRGTLVHVDSRYSMTAANADQWIPINPGREGVLALSIAYSIIAEGEADAGVVTNMIGGTDSADLEAALGGFSPEVVAAPGNPYGIPARLRGDAAAKVIRDVAHEFARAESGLAFGGGSAGGHAHGVSNLSAIYALNYLIGRSQPGRLGGIVFNPAPPFQKPLAASGGASLGDWVTATDDLEAGNIKALLVYGANPVHGVPTRDPVKGGFGDAIKGRDDPDDLFVISFSSFLDDTALLADLVLPVLEPLEDWADDIPEPGPGYQVVGLQQPVVDPIPDLLEERGKLTPGLPEDIAGLPLPEPEIKSFPDEIIKLSNKLGLGLPLPLTFKAILEARADELRNSGSGAPLGDDVAPDSKDAFWNRLLQRGGWADASARSKDSPPAPPSLAELAGPARKPPDYLGRTGQNSYHLVPFLSNSLLDGRGAHLPWLQATPDPMTSVTWQTWIEINIREARKMGLELEEGDVVDVISDRSSIQAIVYPHPAMPPGVVAIPVGQGHTPGLQYATREGEQRGSNIISILDFSEGMKSLPWAATRVVVQPTGRSVRVSKFEGIVPAFPIGTRNEDVIQVVKEAEA